VPFAERCVGVGDTDPVIVLTIDDVARIAALCQTSNADMNDTDH
jgi:hypothetical protein